MSDDVVVRAKAALDGVAEGPWMVSGGVVWREDVVAVPDLNDPSGLTPMPEQVQEKVAESSLDMARFIAAARGLVPELVAEVERLRGELPVELDEDFGWIDRDGDFWSYDDINTWQWWVRLPGCDSGMAIPLAKHGPFVRGRWDYDLNGPVVL